MSKELRVVPYTVRCPSPLDRKQQRFARRVLAGIEGSKLDCELAKQVISRFDQASLECRVIIARRSYPEPSESEWTEWVEVNGVCANSSPSVREYYTPVFEVSLEG